nr:MerR family transcriptional regulator [Ornithinimicrobium cryptoxanthini]
MRPHSGPVTDTSSRLLAIGELSRASGLTVSALRFYDRECVLVPAEVDPDTGYRRYSPGQVQQARLLAGMRRVGMPLAEMSAVLESLPDTEVAEDLLSAHLRRLEDGLTDARREVARLTGLLSGPRQEPLELVVDASALARAIDSVRYAASADPDFPMLCAVLVDPHPDGVRLVATDRYRLAVAEVEGAAAGHAEGRMSLLPTTLVDRLRRALWETWHEAGGGLRVQLRFSPHHFTAVLPGGVGSGSEEVVGETLGLDCPDYRRLLHDERAPEVTSMRIPVVDILAGLAELSQPRVHLGSAGVTTEPGDGVLVDRAFLWEAASTLGEGYAVLPTDGEIAPLALRGADGARLSLVMPVRPEPAP